MLPIILLLDVNVEYFTDQALECNIWKTVTAKNSSQAFKLYITGTQDHSVY